MRNQDRSDAHKNHFFQGVVHAWDLFSLLLEIHSKIGGLDFRENLFSIFMAVEKLAAVTLRGPSPYIQ